MKILEVRPSMGPNMTWYEKIPKIGKNISEEEFEKRMGWKDKDSLSMENFQETLKNMADNQKAVMGKPFTGFNPWPHILGQD